MRLQSSGRAAGLRINRGNRLVHSSFKRAKTMQEEVSRIFRLPLRLSQKLTFIYVLFAAGLLAFVGVLAYSSGRSALEAATNSALLSTVTEKAAALDSWVNFRQANLTALTSFKDVTEDTT